MAPTRWTSARVEERASLAPRPLPPMLTAIGRGLVNRCPVCAGSRVFAGYLRVRAECPVCGTPLGLARADDAPPYFTILIVGHIVVPLMFFVDRGWSPPVWLLAAIFLPLTTALCLLLLRPIKGATVGLMLKLGLLKSDEDG